MSGVLQIAGGIPLRGEVRVAGSKNAALPMMAAALLTDAPIILEGVPRLTDVETLGRVLGELGVRGGWSDVVPNPARSVQAEAGETHFAAIKTSGNDPSPDGQEGGSVDLPYVLQVVDTAHVRAQYELVRRMRASFCVLGPLLARRGKAVVSLPGGCRIGARPVDLHLKGLAALGAELTLVHGYVIARAKRLRGATIDLTGPAGSTVTGTANVLSAAVLARGETVLRGAAREPEIVDLGRLLCKMGARIDGLGTSTLQVRGVEQLGGARHRIIPDRIEAATLALAVAATGGAAEITGADPRHLTAVFDRMADARIEVVARDGRIGIAAPRPPRPCNIAAEPYPGIPSDVQAQWIALMTLASGRSVVSDRVFPHRFAHVPELVRMGAPIQLTPGTAIVQGVGHLTGATVTASDLRASAALVIAGLAARGNTRIEHTHWLDRGYQNLRGKLKGLGGEFDV